MGEIDSLTVKRMEEGCDFRPWDELIPDTLGLIFRNLSLLEILTVVPGVCKSWRKAVMGPYCWQEIDIEEWSQHCSPENIDQMLQLLITRSCGSFRKLCVSGISNDLSFAYIANHAKCLQTLRLPRSQISHSIVEQVAGMLSTLTFLDLSYCIKIGAEALEAIGKNCKFLTGLRRIMHPLEVIDKLSQDDEALAIASTMPKLKHLEIAYLLVSTSSVIEILTNCRQLELLDVRGCFNVNLDENFVKKFPRLKLVGPNVVDYYDMNGWDSCSDYSGSSGYLAWDFVAGMGDDYDEISDGYWGDEQQIEDVEMWFYDDVEAMDAGYDWPQSP
ncbi:F-box protein FBW2-like isoform X1 [Coffea eugenioides]|nr:F-box protein FBW2-like isoform X1 [Coffea arabica]XP_027075281.1 F-box protein FBW2-like isoform X1 [Coffea arabica]XP_027075282.1 F-box protein FBW2-like isoform X1 [Coffea arabica]XP_027075283.1 F-box protein FBW2-like isoform X1 [Coffea arabica]XP_027075284.1 F-box protein FBW2-like isoform X1 [Coffea arabica]XP_027075286.1 F-box protein FBW2-like isoform X1 [Coffea arabica]XP_027178514.1 F-box protein FBW2-like isoform X1 [Coffea eugenioides]XP_027178515.1 F-box protein FBW2-like iso